MFQIIYNQLSAVELSALSLDLQLDLLSELEKLPADLDNLDPEKFGVVERDGQKLYRFRVKDHRVYFARAEEGIVVHRVLHKNTIRDFLFRAKLPMPAEDEELARQKKFWELIEAGRASSTAAHG